MVDPQTAQLGFARICFARTDLHFELRLRFRVLPRAMSLMRCIDSPRLDLRDCGTDAANDVDRLSQQLFDELVVDV